MSRTNPTLAVRSIPSGRSYALAMRVVGGLHYMKGNAAPYFSLTADVHRKGFPNQCQSFGCQHGLILEWYPRFADLAALHLCDIDGAPTHAVENGWYSLAGCVAPELARYHAGNGERNFPIAPPANKPWKTTEHRRPTRDECLDLFADYWRLTHNEAVTIAERVKSAVDGEDAVFQALTGKAYAPEAAAKAVLQDEADRLRPRWKAEADACITAHGLVVYGDPWESKDAA